MSGKVREDFICEVGFEMNLYVSITFGEAERSEDIQR